jgi:hypothetical protein
MINVNFVVHTFVLLVETFVMIHVTDMLNDMIWNLDQLDANWLGSILFGLWFWFEVEEKYSGLKKLKILLGQKNIIKFNGPQNHMISYRTKIGLY